jgi:hypothetical protein
LSHYICGRAEIGRQARLRGVWVSRESSSLSDRTKKGDNMEFFHKNKKIILIILIVLFIELSGYGILASLSRLLNAF